jgi:hypothetical protein
MNWKTISLVGLSAFIGWKIYEKINLLHNINIAVKDFSFSGSLANPVLTINILVNNPTVNSAVFSNLSGNIFNRSGVAVANLSIASSYNIDAKSTIIIPLKVTTNLDLMIVELANYLKNISVNYTAKGIAYIDNLSLPFNNSFNI